MEKPLTASDACCPPQASGLTYLRIGPENYPVGMRNLELVFRQLLLLAHSPDSVCKTELLGMVRRYNYIPRNAQVEVDYVAALRNAYAQYYARHVERAESR